MLDFYEGWDLRNRLMRDGYLEQQNENVDGKEMMRHIMKLAQEHYGWTPAEPQDNPLPIKEYEESLEMQTSATRLGHIYAIAIDWDGYRTIRGLGNLIDEIIACTKPRCRSEHEVLEEVKLVKMFDGIEDFLNVRVSEDKLPFTWNFDGTDVRNVLNWCEEHNYKFTVNEPNIAYDGETIGFPITIEKEVE